MDIIIGIILVFNHFPLLNSIEITIYSKIDTTIPFQYIKCLGKTIPKCTKRSLTSFFTLTDRHTSCGGNCRIQGVYDMRLHRQIELWMHADAAHHGCTWLVRIYALDKNMMVGECINIVQICITNAVCAMTDRILTTVLVR